MRVPTLILLLAVLNASCTRAPDVPAKKETAVPPPKILQFYGSAGETAKGAPVTVCYGVENARSVRLEPPVEKLTPSFNRCFQVTPDKQTTYTLTAEGSDGRTVSESFTVTVKGRPAAASNAQMIRFFATSSSEIGAGQTSTLCYGVSNAKSVKVEPAPMNESRPTTHICRQVFWATIEFSIIVVMNSEARNGRKLPSPTTLSIT